MAEAYSLDQLQQAREDRKAIHAEINRLFGDRLKAIDDVEARAEAKAEHIVEKGARISGYPNLHFDRVHRVEIRRETVRVDIHAYCGEGVYLFDRTLKFPVRWLALDDDAWMAELRAAVEASKEKKEEERRIEIERRREAEAQAERQTYERLKAKYESGGGSNG